MAADDYRLGICGFIQQRVNRPVGQDDSAHRNIGVALPVALRNRRHCDARVWSSAASVGAEADALRGVLRGNVAVGMMECPPLTLDMAMLLRDFHTRHPGVEVALRSGGSDRMVEEVRSAELDMAILGLPPKPLPAKLRAQPLLVEDLVGLVHEGHELSGRVSVADLTGERFIDFPPGYGLREQVDHCFASSGVTRRVVFEVVRVEEMIKFAALGLGIAVLPRSIARAATRRAAKPRVLEIADADLHRTVALVYRQDGPQSPAARAFFELAAGLLPAPAVPESTVGTGTGT
ncbi:LysR substrate-binding domain-containing protein [Nocardia sp.]|uniref:LysR substrate-binding domain-containing protein n=1 Tax=Nocardia sp. TaxID=1821 RepID=UPI002637E6D2|nr:LysR substrate-binding domain-containing protein [Nocardia sp.]